MSTQNYTRNSFRDGLTSYGVVDMQNQKIITMATPTANADAATKLYVDEALTVGNQFFAASGTAASPSYTFVSNVDTGMSWNATTNKLVLSKETVAMVSMTDTVVEIAGTLTLSNPLAVSNGGSGLATVATNSILTGNGTGALTAEATLAYTGTELTIGGSAGNFGIELGNLTGGANTPYIDFHSGATSVDYDARIIASGGTGVSEGGTLEIKAATITLQGTTTITTPLGVASGGTGLATVGTDRILTGNGTGALTAELTLTYTGGQLSITNNLATPNVKLITDGTHDLLLGSSSTIGFIATTANFQIHPDSDMTVANPTGGMAGFSSAGLHLQAAAAGTITDASDTLDVDGTANISGALTLGTALTVANGGTGLTTVATDKILTGNGTGAMTAETFLAYAGNGLQIGAGATTGAFSIEIGTLGGGTSTPFIDFHSHATAVDYDTRIIASGGSGTTGNGTLNFIGSNIIQTTGGVSTVSVAATAIAYHSAAVSTFNNVTGSTSSTTGSVQLKGGLGIALATDATSATNGGTITTAGGIGVAKKAYIGGILTTTDTTGSTSNTTGAVVLSGGIGIALTTDATSATNGGTLTTAGGIAVAKKAYIGTDLSVGGNLTVTGSIPAGVGSWVLIQSQTADASASLDFDSVFSSTYDEYKITISGLLPFTSSAYLSSRFRVAGAYVTTANYTSILRSLNNAGTAFNGYIAAGTFMQLTEVLDEDDTCCDIVYSILEPLNDGKMKGIQGSGFYNTNGAGTLLAHMTGCGILQDMTDELQGIKFYFDTGNMVKGTIKVFGLKK